MTARPGMPDLPEPDAVRQVPGTGMGERDFAYPDEGGRWIDEGWGEPLFNGGTVTGHARAAYDAGERAGREAERAAVVAWLRERSDLWLSSDRRGDNPVAYAAAHRASATSIEAGCHLPGADS